MASTTEDSYLPSSSKSPFNGDVQADLNHSDSMENISSIHNNIFYKTFGKPVKLPSSSSSKPITKDGVVYMESTNDEDIEYRPVSGFVHRLMGRFSKGDSTGGVSASSPFASLSKRSTSLEDVSTDNDVTNGNVFDEPTITNPQKDILISSSLSHRARSIECLSSDGPSRKSQTRPLIIPHLRHVETRQEREKSSRSPRESKIVAPDVDLARDDIIIIESTPSVPTLQLEDQHNDCASDIEVPQVHSYREEALPEELPKPNTVLNVRSIFEVASSNTSKTSNTTPSFVQRHRKSDSSDAPVDKTTQGPSLSLGSETSATRISNRSSSSSISSPTPPILSPRATSNEASAAPVFKLDQSSASTSNIRSHSYSSQRSSVSDLYSPHYNIPDNGKPLSPNSTTAAVASTASSLPTSYTRQVSSSRQSTPRDDNYNKDSSPSSTPSSARNDIGSSSTATSSTSEANKLPSVIERGSLFDSRSAASPRTTASVKPTISQIPPAVVKPIPLSAPASAATSYKKSSPVVPVAPFKKREESEDEGAPVLIYQRSKSPRSKPERQNLNNTNGKKVNKDETVDLIIPKDAKSIFEKEKEQQSTKVVSQKKANNFSPELKSNDNFKSNDSKLNDGNNRNTPAHTSVISVTKEKTVINLSRTTDNDQVDGTGRRTKNNLAPSAPPTRPPRAKNNAEPTGKSRPAPMPPKSSVEEKKKVEVEDTGKKHEGSMIYVSSSSDSNESDSSSPPETPRTQPPVVARPSPSIAPPKSPREPVTPTPVIPPSKTREIPSISPSPRIPREPPSSSPSPVRPRVVPTPEPSDESKDKPIKGIPSIIANRLKQNNSPREISDAIIDSKRDSNGQDSSDAFAVTLRKTGNASTIGANNKSNDDDSTDNKRDSVSNDIEMQIANMRKKMDTANRNRGGTGAKQIFDSSQLAQKRKERKEAAAKAAAAASAQGIVPPLDFSSLNDDNRSTQANVRRKEIKPCNINFIGENAPTSRNLLKKQRKVKINIRFNEAISDTFEYPSEDSALKMYLEEHPNEPEELEEEDEVVEQQKGGKGSGVMFLDSLGGFGESSDDVDDDVINDLEVSTPRGRKGDEDDGLKSNPALSSTSTLQSYRGRFQEEFVFGSHRQEPEPVITKQEPDPMDDPDSMMLRPAEEETVDTWSTNSSSDLLF